MTQRRATIHIRMLAGACLMILLVLPVSGVLLSYNFQQSIHTAFDERLESFRRVCDGVGHAHQKATIHHGLEFSNLPVVDTRR